MDDMTSHTMSPPPCSSSRPRRQYRPAKTLSLLALLASSFPATMAASCISLSGSTACPAFDASSISTDSTLVGLFPFLSFVSSTAEFDSAIVQYINESYVQSKYENILGCNSVNLSNTTNYYARYTISYLCNSIVQNSISPCGLSSSDSRPLCADSCAEMATSEESIAMNSQLCKNPNSNYLDQIRADFTNCALPADSLSTTCITGEENEPDNCGYRNNLEGLCTFCGSSSTNSTDSCCVGSDVETRCADVILPAFISSMPAVTVTSTASASATGSSNSTGTAGNKSHHHGLSGGAIAGIVVGSILGFLLLLALIVLCCILLRKRKDRSHHGSILNQPTPQRRGQSMTYAPQTAANNGYEVLPGGRVARMSALQGPGEHPHQAGAMGGVVDRGYEPSDSDPYGDSPDSDKMRPPQTGKRNGSLSSNSVLAGGMGSSPQSNEYSSPEGVGSGQSEQLPFFKDYYSSDDIHPNDKVAALWAYQPRAGDEFELERGDMLKVVGIWDDGWATGVRIDDRAEDYDGKHKIQRDSGVSNGSNLRSQSPPPTGEIKAFPLVCVCLPEAWKKTVEGDTSTDSGNPPDI